MNFKKLFIYFMAASLAGTTLSSCGDDAITPDAPIVTTQQTEAIANSTSDITFFISVPAGYASSTVIATEGTATIKSEPAVGSTSGEVTIAFTPNISSGTATLTVSSTDQGGNVATHTATLNIVAEQTVFTINANITSNTTWSTGKTYILTGRITVESGATLSIEPGVIIKGDVGSGANSTSLVIARGGKIMAEGTAASPIIFTSIADNITPGQIASPNLAPDVSGLWGGIIVLGKAPISADAEAIQIEGIPPSDTNGLYGGTEPTDNSGVLKYVSIRHGGANIGEGNEINGLTLGGVGSGTTISYVEIVANQDDGIEPFGGTVDVSNILVWNAGDDLFDCDQAYQGTISNFIGILGAKSDHGLELDGPEGTATGSFKLMNGTIKGSADAEGGEYADLRSKVTCTLENIYFFNFKSSSDFELDNEGVSDNWANGDITLTGLEFNVSHLTEGNTTLEAIFEDKSETNNRDAEFDAATANFASLVTTNTVGADKAAFSDWSWADTAGELSDF